MAVGDTIPSRDGTPTPFAVGRPESSAVGSRLARMTTPLLPRTSEYQLPTTPANRLRMTSKRNIATLKPIEKPKTPALVAIDDGIRGYRLYTNPAHNSPPTTPYVRNTQLPPLETPLTMQVEKSPPLTGLSRDYSILYDPRNGYMLYSSKHSYSCNPLLLSLFSLLQHILKPSLQWRS